MYHSMMESIFSSLSIKHMLRAYSTVQQRLLQRAGILVKRKQNRKKCQIESER